MLARCLLAWVCFLTFLSGCGRAAPSSTPEPATPTPTPVPVPGPDFEGTLLMYNGTYLYEVRGVQGLVSVRPYGTDRFVHLAALSPDRRYLLFNNWQPSQPSVGAGENILLDLVTGDRQPVLPEHSAIGSTLWSPDSQRFAFEEGSGIYVSDLSGSIQTVYTPSEIKHYQLEVIGGGPHFPQGMVLAGDVELVGWLDTDHLLFQRYLGDLPDGFTCDAVIEAGPATICETDVVDPNTTTVATLGETIQLLDSPTLWWIKETCADRSHHLLSQQIGKGFGGWYVLKAGESLDSAVPLAVRGVVCSSTGFRPDRCELYCYHGPNHTLTFLDPDTFETLGAYHVPIESIGDYLFWVGDPGQDLVVVNETEEEKVAGGGSRYHEWLTLLSLKTGGKSRLASDSDLPGDYRPLVWLEPQADP